MLLLRLLFLRFFVLIMGTKMTNHLLLFTQLFLLLLFHLLLLLLHLWSMHFHMNYFSTIILRWLWRKFILLVFMWFIVLSYHNHFLLLFFGLINFLSQSLRLFRLLLLISWFLLLFSFKIHCHLSECLKFFKTTGISIFFNKNCFLLWLKNAH